MILALSFLGLMHPGGYRKKPMGFFGGGEQTHLKTYPKSYPKLNLLLVTFFTSNSILC